MEKLVGWLERFVRRDITLSLMGVDVETARFIHAVVSGGNAIINN